MDHDTNAVSETDTCATNGEFLFHSSGFFADQFYSALVEGLTGVGACGRENGVSGGGASGEMLEKVERVIIMAGFDAPTDTSGAG